MQRQLHHRRVKRHEIDLQEIVVEVLDNEAAVVLYFVKKVNVENNGIPIRGKRNFLRDG